MAASGSGRSSGHVASTKPGDHRCVDGIGLGPPAEGLGEVAHLGRVHDDQGQARPGQGGRHHRLEAVGCLTICNPTAPVRAACVRLPPSQIKASANSRRLWPASRLARQS